jgi:hypothetical protein
VTTEYVIEHPGFTKGGEFLAKLLLVSEKEHSADLSGIS